jgi:primosomal protein N'
VTRVPLERSYQGYRMIQADKDDVELLGYLKLDVLGVRMLSAIRHCLDEIARTEHEKVDLGEVPLDDEPTFELIRASDTLGCFQIESPGQRELLQKLQPTRWEDLIVDISLFRPGPVKSDMIRPYLNRRHGRELPTYAHPALRSALQETFGVIVFHEQVIRTLAAMAGYDLTYADHVRRHLDDDEMLPTLQADFLTRATAKGIPAKAAEQTWHDIAQFASFGFCKAHAAAFAVPTYQSAWLKTHYPAHFLAGVLTHDPGMYPRRLILEDAREHGIEILPLDVNRSEPEYVIEEVGHGGGGGAGLRGGRFAPSARSARLRAPAPAAATAPPELLDRYTSGASLLGALRGGSGAFVLRPAPEDEVALAVEAVAAALASGRSAIVLVPEADPLPATAVAIRDAFGDEVAMYLGGSKRGRYRMWLDIAGSGYRVVVGTRPAVFAPVPELGLVWVSREGHGLHREERAPYYHVRDVAVARARLQGAVVVMSALCPSLEASVTEHVDVEPKGRRRWPPVEVVSPGPEGRAPRLVSALRGARRAFLYSPLPGYGIARVCRSCGEPAACAACGGTMRSEEGSVVCSVCGAPGRCAACGASDFGLAKGGTERVEEWARRVAPVPVSRIGAEDTPRPPGEAEVLVGGVEAVKDFGPVGLDLVGILDADLASRRPGLAARERALATWFEAAAWAMPRGRVVVQTRAPNDPAVQALVTGRPERFGRAEIPRRAEAGFPVGGPVFRVVGSAELETELRALAPRTLLVSELEGQTVCLLALDPGQVAAIGGALRSLAERGVVTRVEAEPHL